MTATVAIVGPGPDVASAIAAGVDRVVVAIDPRDVGPISAGMPRTVTAVPIALWLTACDGAADEARLLAALRHLGADELRLPGSAAGLALAARCGSEVRTLIVCPAGPVPDARQLDAVAALGGQGMVLADPPGASGRLLDRATIPDLDGFVTAAHARGLTAGLSGGLEWPDVPRLMALAPDELGFGRLLRALRRDGAPLDPGSIAEVLALVAASRRSPIKATVVEPDRIFVRDRVVDMSIGAYARERTARQRVRVSVEVDLARGADPAARADVVSYDLVTDAIARLAARHIDLVETFAEGLADAVLGHRRVVKVVVTVEKLDLGSGSVGCRLVRGRVPLGQADQTRDQPRDRP